MASYKSSRTKTHADMSLTLAEQLELVAKERHDLVMTLELEGDQITYPGKRHAAIKEAIEEALVSLGHRHGRVFRNLSQSHHYCIPLDELWVCFDDRHLLVVDGCPVPVQDVCVKLHSKSLDPEMESPPCYSITLLPVNRRVADMMQRARETGEASCLSIQFDSLMPAERRLMIRAQARHALRLLVHKGGSVLEYSQQHTEIPHDTLWVCFHRAHDGAAPVPDVTLLLKGVTVVCSPFL